MMLRQLFLLFATFSARCEALRVATRPGLTSVTTTHPCRACILVARPALASSLTSRKIPLVSRSLRTSSSDEVHDQSSESYSKAYFCLGVASILSWTLVSFIVLQSHPDPRFADCTLRHNILTTAQALIFPLPVLGATFVALQSASKVGWNRLQSATYRRLNLGLAVASLWLAASSAFPTVFAFGYDLIPLGIKGLSTTIHLASASLALTVWRKTVQSENDIGLLVSRVARGFVGSIWKLAPTKPSDDPDDAGGLVSSLYALATVGFVWFSASPIVSPYPLATVPSILGKRLTRPAAAFTWLAAVMSYCLKDAADRGRLQASTFRTLRRGLTTGSTLHLGLIVLKLIGIDGGGLILPGSSLWEVYPAMLAVPFATGTSLMVHAIACLAAWTTNPDTSKEIG